MKRIITISFSALVIAAALFISSCKENTDITETNLPHQFRPGSIRVASSTATSVKVEWDASLFTTGTGVKYDVQVSKDQAFAGTPDLSATVDTTGILLGDDKLSIRQKYYIRVRANAVGATSESAWSSGVEFTIPGLQLVSVAATEVIDNSAIVRWTVSADASAAEVKLVITPQTGTATTINLTQTEYATGNRVVTGLAGNTNYTAELFRGTRSQGTSTFKTTAAITGTIVDLRSSSDPTILATTLPTVASGSTIVLKKGMTYTVAATITVDQSFKIVSGPDLYVATPATILVSGGSFVGVKAGATVDYLDFEGVIIRGVTYASSSGSYVINQSANCTIGRISFENCESRIWRGLARLQTATITVNNFIVNNSIIDNLGGYGVLTVDATTCKADNISLTRSTFFLAEKVLTSKQNSTSVTISDNTFYQTPLGGGYIIDYNGVSVTGSVKVLNNIFSIAKGSTATPPVTTTNGKRGTMAIEDSGNFATSDFTDANSANAFSNTTKYTKSSAELFTDPANGNFKIKDTAFPGKSIAGDPRWRL